MFQVGTINRNDSVRFFDCKVLNNCMRFREYILLLEEDPMGGAGAPPMGGDPMGGGMGGPPMGGDPMGGGMGDPMGGGMGGPGGGGQPAPPPVIPKSLDVWAVLDHLLNGKPLPSKEQPKPAGGDPMGGGAGADPMAAMMGGGDPMAAMGGGGAPPPDPMAAMGGGGAPPGGPGPALMG